MQHSEDSMKEILEKVTTLNERNIRDIDNLIEADEVRFPLHAMPNAIYSLIEERKRVLHENINFLTLGAISATATAIGTKVQTNFQYTNKPIFWNAVVAPTGSGKTMPIKAMLEPISQYHNASRITYQDHMAQYEIENENKKSRKSQIKSALPVFKEYIVTDITYEGLIKSHLTNPEGVIIHVDEQIALVNSFGAYKAGKGGDQQNFLTMHDGLAIQKTRATQEQIGIPESCVNIVGGFQPSVIPDFFADSRSDDGFIYRYLYVFEKEYNPSPILTGEVHPDVQIAYNEYIHSLYKDRRKRVLQFDLEAQHIYSYWKNACETYFKNDGRSIAYQAKLNKYVHRLALLFHVFNKEDDSDTINAEDVRLGIHAVEFFRREFAKMLDYTFGEKLNQLPADYRDLYNSLDEEFNWQTARELASQFNIRETSLKTFLGKRYLFEKRQRDSYKKK